MYYVVYITQDGNEYFWAGRGRGWCSKRGDKKPKPFNTVKEADEDTAHYDKHYTRHIKKVYTKNDMRYTPSKRKLQLKW